MFLNVFSVFACFLLSGPGGGPSGNFHLEISKWKFPLGKFHLEISKWKFPLGNFHSESSKWKFPFLSCSVFRVFSMFLFVEFSSCTQMFI